MNANKPILVNRVPRRLSSIELDAQRARHKKASLKLEPSKKDAFPPIVLEQKQMLWEGMSNSILMNRNGTQFTEDLLTTHKLFEGVGQLYRPYEPKKPKEDEVQNVWDLKKDLQTYRNSKNSNQHQADINRQKILDGNKFSILVSQQPKTVNLNHMDLGDGEEGQNLHGDQESQESGSHRSRRNSGQSVIMMTPSSRQLKTRRSITIRDGFDSSPVNAKLGMMPESLASGASIRRSNKKNRTFISRRTTIEGYRSNRGIGVGELLTQHIQLPPEQYGLRPYIGRLFEDHNLDALDRMNFTSRCRSAERTSMTNKNKLAFLNMDNDPGRILYNIIARVQIAEHLKASRSQKKGQTLSKLENSEDFRPSKSTEIEHWPQDLDEQILIPRFLMTETAKKQRELKNGVGTTTNRSESSLTISQPAVTINVKKGGQRHSFIKYDHAIVANQKRNADEWNVLTNCLNTLKLFDGHHMERNMKRHLSRGPKQQPANLSDHMPISPGTSDENNSEDDLLQKPDDPGSLKAIKIEHVKSRKEANMSKLRQVYNIVRMFPMTSIRKPVVLQDQPENEVGGVTPAKEAQQIVSRLPSTRIIEEPVKELSKGTMGAETAAPSGFQARQLANSSHNKTPKSREGSSKRKLPDQGNDSELGIFSRRPSEKPVQLPSIHQEPSKHKKATISGKSFQQFKNVLQTPAESVMSVTELQVKQLKDLYMKKGRSRNKSFQQYRQPTTFRDYGSRRGTIERVGGSKSNPYASMMFRPTLGRREVDFGVHPMD